MSPPQHKIDTTLQAMERAHRASPDDQVRSFSQSINVARRDFERFATAEETANRTPQKSSGSLLALVETEQAVDRGFDYALEQVKESLAEMERKRMLALGAMTRLTPEESLLELRKVKEHILNLALRVPIRADFIVHGHNISLSIFRLFEAAERAEGEVDALINAKRSLDHTTQGGPAPSDMNVAPHAASMTTSGSPTGMPLAHHSDPAPQMNAELAPSYSAEPPYATEQAYTAPPPPQEAPPLEPDVPRHAPAQPSMPVVTQSEPSFLAAARGDYRHAPSPQQPSEVSHLDGAYDSGGAGYDSGSSYDGGLYESGGASSHLSHQGSRPQAGPPTGPQEPAQPSTPSARAPSIAGLRMRQALQRSQERTARTSQVIAETPKASRPQQPPPRDESEAYDIGDEEFDV